MGLSFCNRRGESRMIDQNTREEIIKKTKEGYPENSCILNHWHFKFVKENGKPDYITFFTISQFFTEYCALDKIKFYLEEIRKVKKMTDTTLKKHLKRMEKLKILNIGLDENKKFYVEIIPESFF
jgi:hypothetical protein